MARRDGGSGKVNRTCSISTGNLEAIKILNEKKYLEMLTDRELGFIESLRERTTWTARQEAWFEAIWKRVMA